MKQPLPIEECMAKASDKPNVPELLPCPFCGEQMKHDAKIDQILHPRNGCIGQSISFCGSRDDCKKRWNTRAAMTPAGCGAELREALVEIARTEQLGPGMTHVVYGHKAKEVADAALAATPAPTSGAWTDDVKSRCQNKCAEVGDPACYRLSELTSDAPKDIQPCAECAATPAPSVQASASTGITAAEQNQHVEPKASAPSVVAKTARDVAAEVVSIHNRLMAKGAPDFKAADEALFHASQHVATALREAKLEGAKEERATQQMRAHWDAFCNADGAPEGFEEDMEAAGFIELVETTSEDLENMPFADELGMKVGGSHWQVTPKGRRVLSPETVVGGV
jgi:hypothetical protein